MILDESDKFGASIEDSLLMPLERGLIYIPRYEGGTIGVPDWNSRPIVITTSNDLRHKLSSPFISRHVYSRFSSPSLEKELEILSTRNKRATSTHLALTTKLIDAVRGIAGMEDHPSVRESIDIVAALERDSIESLNSKSLSPIFLLFRKDRSIQRTAHSSTRLSSGDDARLPPGHRFVACAREMPVGRLGGRSYADNSL